MAQAENGRSVRRRSMLSGVDPGTPYAKLMIGCTAVGSNAYQLKNSSGCVDLEQAADILKIIRALLPLTCCTKVPDTAMKQLSSICEDAATSAGLREWQQRLRVWEQEKAELLGEGDDRTRVHMYASTVSAALVSATVSAHGNQGWAIGAVKTIDFDDEPFRMTFGSLMSLSWMCALSGRYTFVGQPSSYIDILSLARSMSARTDAAEVNATAMCAWRSACNQVVDDKVPVNARKYVHLALDQFAVADGPHALKQGSPKSKGAAYILAHSAKPNEKHKTTELWPNAFKVASRQLKALDEMHGMDLFDRAAKAWEGPESLNGRASSDLTPFATTRLYFGRTFPLRLLCPSLPTAFADYVICIWPCPRGIWSHFFATPLVFSVVDSVFCGYVPTSAKATMAHMIDSDGSRADLASILRETGHGEAYYHSDSQPQSSFDDDNDDSEGNDDGRPTPSSYQLVRARTMISKELRERLLAERGYFRKAVREFMLGLLTSKYPKENTLATW
jgi:hypothetical protein